MDCIIPVEGWTAMANAFGAAVFFICLTIIILKKK